MKTSAEGKVMSEDLVRINSAYPGDYEYSCGIHEKTKTDYILHVLKDFENTECVTYDDEIDVEAFNTALLIHLL